MSKVSLCLALTLTVFSIQVHSTPYYQQRDYGSDAFYDPASNFLSYSLDTLQVRQSFSTDNFRDNLDAVFDQLRHPRRAIDNEGGFNRFVNRNIFPVDSKNSNDSYAILPNYALHLVGGGMAYRKDLEWFRDNDYEYATTYAITLAMVAEVIQEAFEQQTTPDDDAIADVYIFRPIGIWLFHDDAFANAFMDIFDPAIWPSLQAFDVSNDELINTGINYVYRPPALAWNGTRAFIFSGVNTLLGMSHSIDEEHAFSWGVGYAVRSIDPNRSQQAELDASVGFFYDRNKSLLLSLVINDTGGDHFRFNYFPDNRSWNPNTGLFIRRNIDDSWSAGLLYRFGFGLAGSSD